MYTETTIKINKTPYKGFFTSTRTRVKINTSAKTLEYYDSYSGLDKELKDTENNRLYLYLHK